MSELIEITVGGLLERMAEQYPNHQCVKYIEREYDMTYSEFNEEVDKVAKGLLGLGIKKGDHVAIWATNYPEWLSLMFATARIGAVLVTVNTNYKIAELEYLLKQSDSKALFVCDGLKDIDCEKTIYELCPELKDSEPGILQSKRLPCLTTVVSIDNRYPGMYKWTDLYKYGTRISDAQLEKAKAQVNCHDVVNMQYTSGTTGFPKGVMLTHYNIVNNGMIIGDHLKLTPRDRYCIHVPFFHCFGMVLSIMASVTHGATMLPLLWFTPMKALHVIEYEKCTAVNGVPTMFISMLEHRDFKKYDMSSLRCGIMAGSPCPEKVMQQVVDEMHMTGITSVYGQTEASPGCTQTSVDDPLNLRVSTVGKKFPHMEVKIINPETGETLGVDQDGEFCVRGYNVMKGYYKMPEATAETVDADGWLHTGDLARVDENGYYKITGRIKDMIIRGGENIYPKEIEEFLYTHPKIQDVQVVGAPSEVYGEEIAAFIILKKGETMTVCDVKDYVRTNMARHKVPSYVQFVESFPMTGSGKIQKFKLREIAADIVAKTERKC